MFEELLKNVPQSSKFEKICDYSNLNDKDLKFKLLSILTGKINFDWSDLQEKLEIMDF